MRPSIRQYLKEREAEFESILPQREARLAAWASGMQKTRNSGRLDLIFICTHNSRRSHFAHIWAEMALRYYGLDGVCCFSGGTEVTAFNPRAVEALRRVGFEIQGSEASNPEYRVSFSTDEAPIVCFSKHYDHAGNPQSGFIAVMTCAEADEACPVVAGAAERMRISFEDPKVSDNSPAQDETYDKRCRQIAREMLYAFSLLKD